MLNIVARPDDQTYIVDAREFYKYFNNYMAEEKQQKYSGKKLSA